MGILNDIIKNSFWKIKDEGYEILHQRAEKPFQNEPLHYSDSRLNDAIGLHNNKWFHNELVVTAENVLVEAQYAYPIDGLRTIIGAGIRTREHLPSPVPALKSYFLGEHESYDKAILLDGSMGANYAHFLSDVLPKLFLLEDYTTLDCPILVGPTVFDKSMVQFVMNHTELKKLNWVKLTKPAKVKELFIARPMPWDDEHWSRVKALFIKEDQPQSERKALFINRTGTRTILNFDEIKKVLDKHGVEVLAPEKLDMRGQALEYNKATHVIGIHGAGMTNIFACNYKTTKVFELCSNNRIGTQFYWLATCLGMPWDMMLGSEADANQSFTLDVKEFEERLAEFLR